MTHIELMEKLEKRLSVKMTDQEIDLWLQIIEKDLQLQYAEGFNDGLRQAIKMKEEI